MKRSKFLLALLILVAACSHDSGTQLSQGPATSRPLLLEIVIDASQSYRRFGFDSSDVPNLVNSVAARGGGTIEVIQVTDAPAILTQSSVTVNIPSLIDTIQVAGAGENIFISARLKTKNQASRSLVQQQLSEITGRLYGALIVPKKYEKSDVNGAIAFARMIAQNPLYNRSIESTGANAAGPGSQGVGYKKVILFVSDLVQDIDANQAIETLHPVTFPQGTRICVVRLGITIEQLNAAFPNAQPAPQVYSSITTFIQDISNL